MTFKAHWKAWVEAKKERAAHRIGVRIRLGMNTKTSPVTVLPYAKGGHVLRWDTEGDLSNWSEAVVELIRLGQDLGSGWQLFGSVDSEIEAILTRNVGHITTPGVTMISWQIRRPSDDSR